MIKLIFVLLIHLPFSILGAIAEVVIGGFKMGSRYVKKKVYEMSKDDESADEKELTEDQEDAVIDALNDLLHRVSKN